MWQALLDILKASNYPGARQPQQLPIFLLLRDRRGIGALDRWLHPEVSLGKLRAEAECLMLTSSSSSSSAATAIVVAFRLVSGMQQDAPIRCHHRHHHHRCPSFLLLVAGPQGATAADIFHVPSDSDVPDQFSSIERSSTRDQGVTSLVLTTM